MSVSLMVESETPKTLTSIASESTFEQYWQPICLELGLQWVPIFQSGLPITQEDIPFILPELEMLRKYLCSSASISLRSDIKRQMLTRSIALTEKLEEMQKNPEFKGFIG